VDMYAPAEGWDLEYTKRIGNFKLRVHRVLEDEVYVWYWTILRRFPGNYTKYEVLTSSGQVAFVTPADAMAAAEGSYDARWRRQ